MAVRKQKILFLTNSDYGQANVVLASAHALLHIAPDVEIHIASFHRLAGAVRDISKDFKTNAQPGTDQQRLIFHGINGMSQFEAAMRPETGMTEAYDRVPGLVNTARNILIIPTILLPWEPDEFGAMYLETEKILNQVRPDITVVDALYTPGLTLCNHLNINWIVLAPNTIKDFAVPLQPGLAILWKYPM
jgi:hypothetical protein